MESKFMRSRPSLVTLMGLLVVITATAPADSMERTLVGEGSVRGPRSSQSIALPLAYFVGEWRVEARDPAADDAVSVVYTIMPSASGRWLTGTADSSDPTVRAQDTWGVDPANGEIVRFVFTDGGAYGTVRSRGWDGDRLVFEGEAVSQSGTVKVRETITKRNADVFDAVWEAFLNGTWRIYSIEVAERQQSSVVTPK